MKITKEETGLYLFLKTVFEIGKSSVVKIYGYESMLYFKAADAKGFYTQKSNVRVGMEYSFGRMEYSLSLQPSGEFILEPDDLTTLPADIEDIGNDYQCSQYVYDFSKFDICQLAKMTLLTNLMLKDSNLKYFNRFKEVTVRKCDKIITLDSTFIDHDVEHHTVIMFDNSGHETELQSQMSMDLNISESAENDFDEVEDIINDTDFEDIDPMSM